MFLRPLAFLIVAIGALPVAAQTFETAAKAAYVYDVTTDTELLVKNADTALPPASMSKLMTLNMLFEALRDGRVELTTRFGVSARAKAMGGSTMFLNERDRPTVEELIQGIVVQSGNDATVVVVEGLAGSEDGFAQQMTQRAKALGMANSNFANASGWPHPNHRMSVRDLGILAKRLITEFPEYYGYFAQTEFPYDGRAPKNRFNRNPLLKLGIGADGLKTGHTSEAGYGLVGSARQGERRVIFVLSGLTSEAARADESQRLVNWAFRQFVEKTIVNEGNRFANVPVWMGEHKSVGLISGEALTLLLPALAQDGIEASVTYDSPVEAPVSKGQKLGEMLIKLPGLPDRQVPLVAHRAVARGGFAPRLRTAAEVLLRNYLGDAVADRL
ncbi:MAG: D-alanyl-D-alanine carboxypeptidase [Rhodobacteraceae bacterium]|nr:D-alanyl-D-alanine carboxypeptidase [Paracoccaceae bacterium]